LDEVAGNICYGLAGKTPPMAAILAWDLASTLAAAAAALACALAALAAFLDSGGGGAVAQGLTPLHLSAQPQPFLTQKHTFHNPLTPRKHPLSNPSSQPHLIQERLR
jgi:hypothetical protein